jgi:hypothetical protein
VPQHTATVAELNLIRDEKNPTMWLIARDDVDAMSKTRERTYW